MNFWSSFITSLFAVRGRRMIIALAIMLVVVSLLDPLLRFHIIGYLPLSSVLRNENDDQTVQAWTLAQAHKLPPNVTPIYIFGGSCTREAIESADLFNDLIKETMPGKTYRVFLTPTSSRNFANDLTVLDTIRDRPGLIVYGIDPNRFVINETDYKNQALGIGAMGPNANLMAFLREKAPHFVPTNALHTWLAEHTYLIPAARLVAERIQRRHFKHVIYESHYYKSRDTNEKLEAEIEKSQANLIEHKVGSPDQLSVDISRRFFRLARAQGHRVLLFEQPIDYAYIHGRMDAQLALYEKQMKTLAREEHVHYINFEPDLKLPSSVFADRAHIFVAEARKPFMERLAAEIKNWTQTPEDAP